MSGLPALRTIGSLCSGYGGLDLGLQAALGGRLAWHAEIDPAAAAVLSWRRRGVPNLGDLRTVDWPGIPHVCVLSAGFPCQDLSLAGRRAGLAAGTRSGLWSHIARAIAAVDPCLVVIENVPGILSAPAHSDLEPCPWCLGDTPDQHALRALGAVLGDLAALGRDARWCVLRADQVGAPHRRARLFLAAWRSGAVEDPDLESRHHRRLPAPGQAQTRRPRAEPGRRGGAPPAHSAGERRHQGLGEPAGQPGRPDHAQCRHPAALPPGPNHRRRDYRSAGTAVPADSALHDEAAWGTYAAAIARWESRTRPAPPPTGPGGRLSPVFVEWLMGLPAGWVTDVPVLSRPTQLRVLGNGVVPQQAAAALRLLAPPSARCPYVLAA